MQQKATYQVIQDKYFELYDHTIKTCWIADIKRELGLPVKTSVRRIDPTSIKNKCPESKRSNVVEVFILLKVI